jgi:hypothetical protein
VFYCRLALAALQQIDSPALDLVCSLWFIPPTRTDVYG